MGNSQSKFATPVTPQSFVKIEEVEGVSKVFNNVLLVDKILSNLDLKDLLSVRQVGNPILTKIAHKHLLKIGEYGPDTIKTKKDVSFPEHLACLRQNVRGTWFTKAKQIQQFMEDMEGPEEIQPLPNEKHFHFPTRTVIFALRNKVRVLNMFQKMPPKKFDLLMTRFMEKYGKEIRSVFIALEDTRCYMDSIKKQNILLNHILEAEDLQFVNIFIDAPCLRKWDVQNTFKLTTKAGQMGNLKQVQLLGRRSWALFPKLFNKSVNATQIESLHIGTFGYHSFVVFYKSPVLRPKLKKLYIYNYFWSFKRLHYVGGGGSPFNQLEELLVTFDQANKCCRLGAFLDILKFAQFNFRETMRKISLLTPDGFTICETDHTFPNCPKDSLDDNEKMALWSYPNLEKIDIDSEVLELVPDLSHLFGWKLPRLNEILVSKGFLRGDPDKHDELKNSLLGLRPNNSIVKYFD